MGFFTEYKQVSQLLKKEHGIVFYAESRHYYQYYRRLVSDYIDAGESIVYITSDKTDPLLQSAPGQMAVVYCNWMLAFLFKKIKAKIFIMTMPDLDNFLFKRSSTVEKYVYVFHSAVSTHQQYRKNAFNNYDVVCCTGSYQVRELLAAEQRYGLKEKKLLEYGYPLFEEIRLFDVENRITTPTILIAPSWFDGCIFDTCIEELLEQLSALPYEIVLRSHPEYEKRKRKNFDRVATLLKKSGKGRIDREPNVIKSLVSAAFLITDRSGIALEFAFGCRRPVLFIDTVSKETNKDWRELNIEPVENKLRTQIGVSIDPGNLHLVAENLERLKRMQSEFRTSVDEIRKATFFEDRGLLV